MSNSSQPSSNQSIEEILEELEKKFGVSDAQTSSKSSAPNPRRKSASPALSPNLLMGTLALVLLIVGVASAMFLSGRDQDLRQQAQVYNTPSATPQGPTPTPITCTGSRIDLSVLDNGTAPADNLLLNTQYQASTGLSFSLQPQLAVNQETRDACAATTGPRIALAGAPRTAFEGMQGNNPSNPGTPDTTYPGDRAQSPFMTDSADLQDYSCPVRISITQNFRKDFFIFDLVDMDNGEQSIIYAYDATGQLVTSQTVGVPSGNMQYDGRSFPITLIGNRPIAYVDIVPQGNKGTWGVAYDNFCVYPQNTPTPSPTPAPVCTSLNMNPINPSLGTQITLTCGPVAGVSQYQFRVRQPNGSFSDILSSVSGSNISAPFTITQSGQHVAQCRICTGVASSTCSEWETIN